MIELRGVSKTVTSGDHQLTILHPIDLAVPSGQRLAIVGPSGSGKSTLLGLIAGLDAPSSGSILIDGTDITRLGEDQLARLRGEKIGFVFQSFHLIPSLTALENILVPMEIAGRRDAASRARSLLVEVGLEDRGHHYPSQLSGGEQQRVAIARALSNEPVIVLADEPTGNLDSADGPSRHRAAAGDQSAARRDAGRRHARSGNRLDGRRARLSARRQGRGARETLDAIRPADGPARNAIRLEAAGVLLRLHRHRRRRDRRAAVRHSERARVLSTEARTLIAADILLSTDRPWQNGTPERIASRIAGIPDASRIDSIEMATMARPVDESAGITKVVELRAVQPGFPVLRPPDAAGWAACTRMRCSRTTAPWCGRSCSRSSGLRSATTSRLASRGSRFAA